MHVDTTIRNQLKKIARLAERGATMHERDAAQGVLARLLAKYNLTLADVLVDEHTTRYPFTWRYPWERKLLFQLTAYIGGRGIGVSQDPRNARRINKRVWIWLTKAQHAELAYLLPIYTAAFEQELALFLDGFIQANDLGLPPDDEERPVSPEERARVRRILNMADTIEPTTVVPASRLLPTNTQVD